MWYLIVSTPDLCSLTYLEALIQRYCLHEIPTLFTLAKYENVILSLCETTDMFIDPFFYSKIHFQQLGSFKLIKTMLKSLNVCKVYLQCGIVIQRVVTNHGLPSVQISRMLNLKIEFAKNKYLGIIWSTEMNPIA